MGKKIEKNHQINSSRIFLRTQGHETPDLKGLPYTQTHIEVHNYAIQNLRERKDSTSFERKNSLHEKARNQNASELSQQHWKLENSGKIFSRL